LANLTAPLARITRPILLLDVDGRVSAGRDHEAVLDQPRPEVVAAACTAGVIGTCASAIMRSGAMMAGSAVTAVGGGAWAGAPDVVQQVIGGAAGAGLSDLASLQPAAVDISCIRLDQI
jgi:hypothetical protein